MKRWQAHEKQTKSPADLVHFVSIFNISFSSFPPIAPTAPRRSSASKRPTSAPRDPTVALERRQKTPKSSKPRSRAKRPAPRLRRHHSGPPCHGMKLNLDVRIAWSGLMAGSFRHLSVTCFWVLFCLCQIPWASPLWHLAAVPLASQQSPGEHLGVLGLSDATLKSFWSWYLMYVYLIVAVVSGSFLVHLIFEAS